MLGHYVQKKVMEFNFWKKNSHCPKMSHFYPNMGPDAHAICFRDLFKGLF